MPNIPNSVQQRAGKTRKLRNRARKAVIKRNQRKGARKAWETRRNKEKAT